ncbi:beta-ketoacyl synthase N-terminal-like domain-containing protein [Dechloromonas sp.]|uniref:beta-ketoacyl synthase N-terminal-like domain-containing protein n=1 Tax=Dechloromonas sp. TaxID=1917218 RepID=UPI00286EB286|nr:beta-ketoacyl synthase N-terminal-like domain-containing protein [Dechloromonas sp.]
MTRPVFINKTALLCARGNAPAAVASALWNAEFGSGQRKLGERAFPYFALPLDETNWMLRAEQAIRQLAGQLGQFSPETPLFIASSSFQIGHFEQLGVPFELPVAAASFSRQIAEWMGLNGAISSFSNACTSGFSALDAARSLIAAGLIDDAIILGVELANDSTLAGFAAMELLSRTAGRPFDARRDGLVLGEAVAAVYLSAKPANWRIAGLRTGLDGFSTTGPNPDGSRIADVAVDCLNEANLRAADIELIKLQAAGSPGTDLAEANALRTVFGQHMPLLLSLKPGLGHTLGASGMAELAALLACLDADKIPATAGFSKVDPEIALFPMVERSTEHIERALLNLIGFGGGLASLIVERHG